MRLRLCCGLGLGLVELGVYGVRMGAGWGGLRLVSGLLRILDDDVM